MNKINSYALMSHVACAFYEANFSNIDVYEWTDNSVSACLYLGNAEQLGTNAEIYINATVVKRADGSFGINPDDDYVYVSNIAVADDRGNNVMHIDVSRDGNPAVQEFLPDHTYRLMWGWAEKVLASDTPFAAGIHAAVVEPVLNMIWDEVERDEDKKPVIVGGFEAWEKLDWKHQVTELDGVVSVSMVAEHTGSLLEWKLIGFVDDNGEILHRPVVFTEDNGTKKAVIVNFTPKNWQGVDQGGAVARLVAKTTFGGL